MDKDGEVIINFEYQKVESYTGSFAITPEEFKKGKDYLDSLIGCHYDDEYDNIEDYSEVEYVGASCTMCAKEFHEFKDIAHIDNCGQLCLECYEDEREQAEEG